ncbi:type II toxin-antitoxin system RelE family toxin [Nostoc sp. 'Peltigera malacea cyanobiont' DB3992]|uniref:type II toxin-antitoxin system RelE family toxin n=1 Tax=Nostoc sp. 'Peltigera malacea cyanobiont' DB3992 TaxID=1206980 RepID=UPI0015D4D1B5|nr:type II toxin-antitoxin system mRNA interferase toxin, RelE/StbE family [Nostoc sp. 'Peltigera malacea cyanobiont' DB3992]
MEEEIITNEELNSIHDSSLLIKNELLFLSPEKITESLLILWAENDDTSVSFEEDIQTKLNQIVSYNKPSDILLEEEEILIPQNEFSDEEIAYLFPPISQDISSSIDSQSCFSCILSDVWGEEPQSWNISMTPSFIKDIKNIDKKIHDLVLNAINQISEYPMKILGKTVKPLTGEKRYKGFWRYRIKDKYRLLYQPIKEEMKVILHSLKSRAEAYD